MNLLDKLLEWVKKPNSKMPWWVKITTEVPKCTYFFGPFDSFAEANQLQSGYIEDLKEEKAQGVMVEIQQAEPKQLTIIENDDTNY